MKYLSILVLLLVSLTYSGCGDDDDGPSGGPLCTQTAFNNDVNDAVTNLNSAATTFANDPTTANCNEYVTAGNAYLDVVEGYENCAVLNQQQFDDALQAARDAVNSINC